MNTTSAIYHQFQIQPETRRIREIEALLQRRPKFGCRSRVTSGAVRVAASPLGAACKIQTVSDPSICNDRLGAVLAYCDAKFVKFCEEAPGEPH